MHADIFSQFYILREGINVRIYYKVNCVMPTKNALVMKIPSVDWMLGKM